MSDCVHNWVHRRGTTPRGSVSDSYRCSTCKLFISNEEYMTLSKAISQSSKEPRR